jgi:hypothetical protein
VSYDGGRNTALVLRILRAIVIGARVDGRKTRPDIFAAVNLLPPDHMDQGFNRPWRNSPFAGIRFLCHNLPELDHQRFVITQPVISPTLQAPVAKRAILFAL